MYPSRRILCGTVVILLHACIAHISSFPHNASNDDMEIITVEEIAHFAAITKNLTGTLITQSKEQHEQDTELSRGHDSNSSSSSSGSSAQNEASNEPAIDTADDLIFLAERPQQQHYEQHNEQKVMQTPASVGTSEQIDLLTSAEEDSLTAISTAAASGSTSKSSEHDNVSKADSTVSGVPSPQIELRIRHVSADNTEKDIDNERNESISEDDDAASDDEERDVPSAEVSVAPIDMSDFVALIPAAAVKSIAANYYRNDPEVQRAYAYLSSREFTVLRQHIIELPEVKAFLRYLNNSGLDVVGFLNTLTNLTCKPEELMAEENTTDDVGSGSEAVIGNEIEDGLKLSRQTTTSPGSTTTAEEQLNGLHGLVDSILDILPQDQILATFFDKLESSEQFSKLVDNIGQPAFARILHNVQNSAQLRTLVFTLHNNGIYITRIVDSLKAYFFLGTF